jgi:hypothetical protein
MEIKEILTIDKCNFKPEDTTFNYIKPKFHSSTYQSVQKIEFILTIILYVIAESRNFVRGF